MSLFVSLKNCNQSKNLETIDISRMFIAVFVYRSLVDKDEIGDGGFAVLFTAMIPGELASSAGNYDDIQTAKFTYNVVIINADNALNPSTKMRIIYTAIQKTRAIFKL
jgi:hypothetical protein